MKAKFEQKAFFRQISKRLVNYHACLETLGGTGSDVSYGRNIASIKNYAGADSFTQGQKYGRNFVVFESAKLSAPSGNSADLVVTTGRYNKIKKQISSRIKKTYQLTLVGNANSLEGCYLKDDGDSVTSTREKICNSIEAATWDISSSSCKLTSPFNRRCPAGEALDEIDSTGSFQCCEVKWNPHPNQWCDGVNFRQKTGCEGERTATGIKTPNIWSPSPGTVCHGQSFTQTETCCRGFTSCAPNTRTATGSKCCGSCGSPGCAPCPPPPPPSPPTPITPVTPTPSTPTTPTPQPPPPPVAPVAPIAPTPGMPTTPTPGTPTLKECSCSCYDHTTGITHIAVPFISDKATCKSVHRDPTSRCGGYHTKAPWDIHNLWTCMWNNVGL